MIYLDQRTAESVEKQLKVAQSVYMIFWTRVLAHRGWYRPAERDFVKFRCHVYPSVTYSCIGNDKQPMDKSSRYTFGHVAEFATRFRDLHVEAKHTESDRSILWPTINWDRRS